MPQEKFVLPGDFIAAAEEYMPGEGTYDSEGRILAARAGLLVLDDDEMVASVLFPGEPVLPEAGDIAIGEVSDVGGKLVSVDIAALERSGRGMPADSRGALHISRMSEGHVDDPRKIFRPGDVVRAEISMMEPSVQLSTAGPELGIVKAYCGKCRGALVRKGSQLFCEECERTETRKMSGHYDRPPDLAGS